MRCQSMIGEFKNSRALPINVLFRFIMFVNYYIVNETQVLQWQAYSLARHKTWVRIPGLSHSQYYFFIINHVQRQRPSVPYAHAIKPTRVLEI